MKTKFLQQSLSDCLDTIIDYRGKTPKKLGLEWSDSGFRAISANNVKFDGLTKIDSINCLNYEGYKKWMKEEVKKGDLLLTSEAPAGQVMLWMSEEKIVLSQRLFALRTKPNIYNKYLKYYLQSNVGQFEINKNTSGSTVFGISAKMFDFIKVNLPDFDSQVLVGDLLFLIDSKIELNNRINNELEAIAKTIYDYWFVQFDFPDVNGKPYKSSGGKMVWNEELKREIPAGWEVVELKDIANISMGQSPPGESYNEDGEGMIFYQGSTDFGNRFPSVRKFTTQPSRFAKEGDILLSVRAPVGTLNISKEDCCIGRGLAALNSKDNCVAYLFGVMVNLKQIFDRRNVNGTTFGSITKDDLFSLGVIKPEKCILKQFYSFINPAFEKQNKLELENQKLSELRDWLLPMLMNGQVKVN
jgi:type I restriction enzyme S subunit